MVVFVLDSVFLFLLFLCVGFAQLFWLCLVFFVFLVGIALFWGVF